MPIGISSPMRSSSRPLIIRQIAAEAARARGSAAPSRSVFRSLAIRAADGPRRHSAGLTARHVLVPLCSLNHPEREHVTGIVSHYAAPACGTKLGYVDQPSGRYSSAKPGSKIEYRARRVQRGAHLSQFGRKAKTRLRYYVALTMNGVEAASGFAARRPNEGFDRAKF